MLELEMFAFTCACFRPSTGGANVLLLVFIIDLEVEVFSCICGLIIMVSPLTLWCCSCQ